MKILHSKPRLRPAAFFALLLFAASAVFAQNERRYPWQYFWQQSLAAYGKKDYPAFLDHAKRAFESGPANHPTLVYNVARAYSLNGDRAEAVKWLEKTLALGYGDASLDGEDFSFLRDAGDYALLRQKINRLKAPVIKSRAAFTIAEPDMIPEGIAYDEKTGSFFVGSTYRRKIVRIDRRGRVADFVAAEADGLGSVLGMKVDSKRRILWVLNNFMPEMKNFAKERNGVGMIHQYDLESGKLVKKLELANQPRPHLLNDLAITTNGDAFITDSLSSVVHILRQGENEPEVFVAFEPFSYPNGIALSPDETKLYVASMNGVSVINVKTGERVPLSQGGNIALPGIDGLYFDVNANSLIAIQNFETPARIVRFQLDAAGTRIEKMQVLERNHPSHILPTTGAIARGDFFYIANSQLRAVDENGKIAAPGNLKNVMILKMKL